MAREACSGCGIRCAVGLLRCPRCGTVTPLYASRVGAERPAADPFADLSFKQLRQAAKARGLTAGGTAAELAARIREHDAAEAGGAP